MIEHNILSQIQKYKNFKAEKYEFLDFENLKDLQDPTYYCSKKIDGQTCFVCIDGSSIKIYNANLVDYSNKLSHLVAAAKPFANKNLQLILAGELYYDEKGNRERNGDVLSALGGSLNSQNLKICIFDVVLGPGHEENLNYEKKLEFLNSLIDQKESLIYVASQILLKKDQVPPHLEMMMKADVEGVILRNDRIVYKVKKTETLDLVVLGYTLNEKQELRSLSMGLVTSPNQYLFVASSGNFLSDVDKKNLLKNLSKDQIASDYYLSGSDGSVYQFVKPNLVVEVSFLDHQWIKSNDRSIMKMTFVLSENQLKAVRLSNSVSLIASTIVRFRSDKQVNENDCGLSQLKKIFSKADAYLAQNNQENMKPSQIVERKVYVKKSKKGNAIKKFILWKTHKELNKYSAFISYFMDFSSSRKTPMDKSIKPFSSEAEAKQYQKKLMEEEIKKGWEEYRG
jgi:hypothetical protein